MIDPYIVGKEYKTEKGDILKYIYKSSKPLERYGKKYSYVFSVKRCGEDNFKGSLYFDDKGIHIFNNFEIIGLLKNQEENIMYLPTTIINIKSDNKRFVIVDMEDSSILGIFSTLEEAKKEAQRQLEQGSEFYILQVVSKITPKPLDAEIEDFK